MIRTAAGALGVGVSMVAFPLALVTTLGGTGGVVGQVAGGGVGVAAVVLFGLCLDQLWRDVGAT